MINNLKLIDSIDLDEFKKNIKDARENKKITIEQASKTLHIEKNIIEMLEEGNFKIISIDIFILGHIKTYLNWIGIDHKLLINDNNKTENISLKGKKHKIVLPYSLKFSKLYISILSLFLFIIILIIFNNKNNLEVEEDNSKIDIEKYENFFNEEQNNNPTQKVSREKIDLEKISQKPNNEIKLEKISQKSNDEIKLEKKSLVLKEKADLENISQKLKEKVEYNAIKESKIIKGNTILGLLLNIKWGIKDAMEAVNIFSTIYEPKKINTYMSIILPKDRNIKAFAITINKDTAVVVTKMKNGKFLAQKKSLKKARDIISSSQYN